jgi:hypothetical protein
VVADAEVAGARRGRLGRRLGAIGLLSAGVFGVGAAATAADLVPVPWFESADAQRDTRTLASGTVCEMTFAAREVQDPDHAVPGPERLAAVSAAREFLRDFDLRSIDVEAAVTRYRATDRTLRSSEESRSQPKQEQEPRQSPVEVEQSAIQAELGRRLDAHLRRQGLPAHAVSVAGAFECDGGTEQ